MVVPFQAEAPQQRPHPLRLQPRPRVQPQQVLHRALVHLQHVHKVLGVAADAELVGAAVLTLGGADVPAQKVQKRRLARAVGAHDGHPGAHVHPQVEPGEAEVRAARVGEGGVHERQ